MVSRRGVKELAWAMMVGDLPISVSNGNNIDVHASHVLEHIEKRVLVKSLVRRERGKTRIAQTKEVRCAKTLLTDSHIVVGYSPAIDPGTPSQTISWCHLHHLLDRPELSHRRRPLRGNFRPLRDINDHQKLKGRYPKASSSRWLTKSEISPFSSNHGIACYRINLNRTSDIVSTSVPGV